jgi:hypothetical protein
MPPEIMPVCAVEDGTSKARSNAPSRRNRSAAIANAADQPRRVFDCVDTARRARRMRSDAIHAASVSIIAFVRDDRPHASRLTYDAPGRADAPFREFRQQQGGAETADFLVERKCEMQRLTQQTPLDQR